LTKPAAKKAKITKARRRIAAILWHERRGGDTGTTTAEAVRSARRAGWPNL